MIHHAKTHDFYGNCWNSLYCIKLIYLFNNVVDYELQRSPWEAKLVNNSFKKSRKRSKRISEIDTPGINVVHFCSSMRLR
jgi:CRISPR/Cas system-associated endoribonuclease Cas2